MNHFDITAAQSKAWSILARSYSSGRVASTYLFSGREGLGHWSLAVSFAALVNCEKPEEDDRPAGIVVPCRQCRSCRSVFGLNFEGFRPVVPIGSHKNANEAIDLTNEVFQAKRDEPFVMLTSPKPISIPISMAREVKRSMAIAPAAGVTRVVLFYQMNKMKPQSADALLKMIEEPPTNTIILLTAERSESLLPTIQSRSQKIRLERLPELMVETYLTEKYELSAKRARLLTRITDCNLGRAIELIGDGDDDEAGRRPVGMMLFRSLVEEPAADVIAHMVDLFNLNDRSEAASLLQLWQSLLRDCSVYALTGEESDLLNVDFSAEIVRLSAPFATRGLTAAMVDVIKNTLADLGRNVHIQAAFVALVLKLKAILTNHRAEAAREVTSG